MTRVVSVQLPTLLLQRTASNLYAVLLPTPEVLSSSGLILIYRYSKRDIGRLFDDINAKDMSQEYGGLELVQDNKGFMAFNCELVFIELCAVAVSFLCVLLQSAGLLPLL